MRTLSQNEIQIIRGGKMLCSCGGGAVPTVGERVTSVDSNIIAKKPMASGRQCQNHCCNEVLADWFFWDNDVLGWHEWAGTEGIDGAC